LVIEFFEFYNELNFWIFFSRGLNVFDDEGEEGEKEVKNIFF